MPIRREFRLFSILGTLEAANAKKELPLFIPLRMRVRSRFNFGQKASRDFQRKGAFRAPLRAELILVSGQRPSGDMCLSAAEGEINYESREGTRRTNNLHRGAIIAGWVKG